MKASPQLGLSLNVNQSLSAHAQAGGYSTRLTKGKIAKVYHLQAICLACNLTLSIYDNRALIYNLVDVLLDKVGAVYLLFHRLVNVLGLNQ